MMRLPVNDGLDLRHFAKPFDEVTKIGNHLGRALGKVNRMNIHASRPIDDAVDRIAGHDFLPLRACVYMTMDAGHIAELAEVELENFVRLRRRESPWAVSVPENVRPRR